MTSTFNCILKYFLSTSETHATPLIHTNARSECKNKFEFNEFMLIDISISDLFIIQSSKINKQMLLVLIKYVVGDFKNHLICSKVGGS